MFLLFTHVPLNKQTQNGCFMKIWARFLATCSFIKLITYQYCFEALIWPNTRRRGSCLSWGKWTKMASSFITIFLASFAGRRRRRKVEMESNKETWVSRSEESLEEMGEEVSKVLKEREAFRSRFLTIPPTRTFSGCNPSGHPSSCTHSHTHIY